MVLYYLEGGGDYCSLIEYFRRFKFLKRKSYEAARSKLKRDIPGMIKSKRWENLAFRYLILDKTDELVKIIPEIKINAHNYIFHLAGEKKHYAKAVEWCSRNNLLEEAGWLLLKVDKVERAAEVLEKGGILNKAADYYEQAGRLEKAASIYKRLRRFTRAGDIYYKMRDYRTALKTYQRQSPPNKKKMAKTYERLGDYDKALKLWKETGEKKGVKRCLTKLEKTKQKNPQFLKGDCPLFFC
jgi:tetratricopeptide (TPR) repeat protein